jgi:hypothetical protein
LLASRPASSRLPISRGILYKTVLSK